jgi:CRP/FNR family cyclic AMP-dependent transcriptional regulator
MKKFIQRLKGAAGASSADSANGLIAQAGETAEDSRFFSTMFQDRSDDALPIATWKIRSAEVGAQVYDRAHGVELFSQLWGADRYVASLSRDELERMSQYLEFVEVPADKQVIGQDEQGDYMLIVLEGSISVDRIHAWGARARLAEARPGDILGEMSLLDAGSRFSACTTITPCVLAVVDAHGLDLMITHEPRLGLALLASLARRLSLRLRQVSARLSALLSRG